MTPPKKFPQIVDSRSVRLVIDYGHFDVFDPQAIPSEASDLHALAEASPPSYAVDGMAVVLSPHQNNFDTPMTVECWSSRPDADREQWEQVSENAIQVESGKLYAGTPGGESLVAETIPGTYILEVSGRGFVNYGWPGSTEPGDEWRLRLWPARTDPDGARAPQLWHQPGYGVPEPAPFRPDAVAGVPGDDQDLGGQELGRPTSVWDSVPDDLHYFNGAVALTEMDPELVTWLIQLPEARQREIAWWCTDRALELAGLDTEKYILDTVARIKTGGSPPSDAELFAWLNDVTQVHEESPAVAGQAVWERIEHSRQQHPYASGEISRPHHAIVTLSAVAASNPLRAAVETLDAACSTYSDQAPNLIELLKIEFNSQAN